MTTHGPDWFRVATIPGVSPEAAVHVRREFQDALGTLPRTADEAVAWAHREYAAAERGRGRRALSTAPASRSPGVSRPGRCGAACLPGGRSGLRLADGG
jgi:hypothetical protein